MWTRRRRCWDPSPAAAPDAEGEPFDPDVAFHVRNLSHAQGRQDVKPEDRRWRWIRQRPVFQHTHRTGLAAVRIALFRGLKQKDHVGRRAAAGGTTLAVR